MEELEGKENNLVVLAPENGLNVVRTLVEYFHQQPDNIRSLYLVSSFKDEKGILFQRDRLRWNCNPNFHMLYTLTDAFSPGYGAGDCISHLASIPFASFGDHCRVIIAGPQHTMRETAKACLKQGVPADQIWVCLERKMYCAAGKCGHCKINETYVCLEGPVFPYTKAETLLD